MKKITCLFVSLITASICFAETTSLTVSEKALMKDGPFSKLLQDSIAAYTAVKAESHEGEFIEAEKKARCVLIFPRTTTVALVAGGSHGDGVASCHNDAGKWSGPLFLDFNAGSIGIQAGAENSKTVVFLTDATSQQQLVDGKLSFSPTNTFVAGEKHAAMKGLDNNKPIAIFSNQKGLFGGVALSGMYVEADRDELRAFYKEPVELKTVVTTYQFNNPPGELTTWMKILPARDG